MAIEQIDEIKKGIELSLIKGWFPAAKLSRVDYIIGGLLLIACFFSFAQSDIYATGWNALNYLFGNTLDFYENCKRIQGAGKVVAASYPPSVYVIFAIWLYPFKYLGFLKSAAIFPPYLVYWLKLLTSLVYIATGFIFYKVIQCYQQHKGRGKHAALIWLTTPLALFPQFIFSQYDIFYVFFTLVGFLYFLKQRILLASFLFGLAITFKYFPFFVFLPLLLFFEKKIARLLLAFGVFLIPTFCIYSLYGRSPAFMEGVVHFSAMSKIFFAAIDAGGPKIYYVVTLFAILMGVCYTLEVRKENYLHFAAYIFLISSTFPFLFILWHPQWILFITPAIVLTTIIVKKEQMLKFLLFDLVGMLVFVAYISLVWQHNVDAAMFHPTIFHVAFEHNYTMANIFSFGKYSADTFFSLFTAYLLLQIILKYPRVTEKKVDYSGYSYHDVRIRYYIGLLIFVLPVMLVIYKNKTSFYLKNEVSGQVFGELLRDRTFEESFVAICPVLNRVELLLATFMRINQGDFQLEILDEGHKSLASIKRSASAINDNAWAGFDFNSLKLQKNKRYSLKLSSNEGTPGNAITWWASPSSTDTKGSAIVDGIPQNSDFAFKLEFNKC
jgi:hypothetical protein